MNHDDEQDRLMDMLLEETLGARKPPDLTERILAQAFPAPRAASPVKPVLRRIGFALAVAAVLVLSFSLWLHLRYPSPVATGDFRVAGGGPLQRDSVIIAGNGGAALTLGGYCRVELAPGTALQIGGTPGAEALRLADGQITCDVQHGRGGFIVRTDVGDVLDTGTQFSVALTNEDEVATALQGAPMITRKLTVAVVTGAVLVTGVWGQVPLAPGQQQTFTAATTTQPAQTTYRGGLAAIAAGQLTLQTTAGQIVVTLTDTTLIHLNTKPATAADLKPGMSVIAFTSDGQTATEIRAYTPQPTPPAPPPPALQHTVSGSITQVGNGQVTLQGTAGAITVALTDTTTYKVNGQPGTLADLKPGMNAIAISTDGKTATEIRAYAPQPTPPAPPPPAPQHNVSGSITQAGADHVTFQSTAGLTTTIAITGATTFKVNGQPATLADLKPGMNAIAISADGQTATEIRAYTPQPVPPTPPAVPNNITGTISQIANDQLTLQSSTKSTTVTLTPATTFNVSGKAAAITDLRLGMHALAVSTDGKTATEIKAYMPQSTTIPSTTPSTTPPLTTPTTSTTTSTTRPATTQNLIRGILTGGENGVLTMEVNHQAVSLAVTDQTVVKIGTKVGKLTDLKAGMTAYVVVTPDGKTATEIRAYPLTSTTAPK